MYASLLGTNKTPLTLGPKDKSYRGLHWAQFSPCAILTVTGGCRPIADIEKIKTT